MSTQTALLLFSGGQDSATCLYWGKREFSSLEALFFHYEQRHRIEYESAKKFAEMEDIILHELQVPAFKEIGGTAMIEELKILNSEKGIPNTFVPGRNIVFLALAASLAYRRGIRDLLIGVNDAEYSAYPDCHGDFIKSMQETLNQGLGIEIRIHAPLQKLDKAEIWALSEKLGALDKILEFSHSCYLGKRGTRQPWGYGCGNCPACRLRKSGFERFIENKKY